jgi:uncharacterized cofD-like protein
MSGGGVRGLNLRRWLMPGIGVKRWLLVVFAGLLLLALAAAQLIRQLSASVEPGSWADVLVDAITLQALPYPLRGLIVGAAGGALLFVGAVRVVRVFTEPFRSPNGSQPLVELIYQKRFLARGPRIVAIGGGTGLSTLLRGLKEHTANLTAVVTVADDGGSSGALREQLGIPPVGDIRNCIAALADSEPLMRDLLQYRFPGPATDVRLGEPVQAVPGALAGHPVGNLLLAALTDVEGGDFEEGVRQMNRVLAVRGRVVPVSPTPVTLHAQLRNGQIVDGQSRIAHAGQIERVWLTPQVTPTADALAAIADADVIVVGPGSLYTSLLPTLLVPGVQEAIAASGGLRIFVCNVATQAGETDGFDLADHVEALAAHSLPGLFDIVLANNQFHARIPAEWQAETVRLRWPPSFAQTMQLVLDEVVDPENAHHHDPARLAAALLRVIERERPAQRRVGAVRSA